jgi:surface antigen
MTLSGIYRWQFDAKQRAWTVKGHPGIRVKATVIRGRGGYQHVAWVLEPGGDPFVEYQEAMLTAEQRYGSRSVSTRIRARSRR